MATPNYARKMLEQITERLDDVYASFEQGIKADNAVPNTRRVNGKQLNADIVLNAADVKARSDTWLPTPAQIKAIPVVTNAKENNFASFNVMGNVKDSGYNKDSFLPAKYTAADSGNILTVDNNGTVNAVPSVFANLQPYDPTKTYKVGDCFYYGSGSNLAIYTTTTPHGPQAYDQNKNMMISKVGESNSYVNFTLTAPAANTTYILSGTLQQQVQGLLNNIKNLRDRVQALENNAVTTDTPRVKLNITSTVTTPQAGYKIVRIDPANIL